jgi:thiamine kinase-like enzyme
MIELKQVVGDDIQVDALQGGAINRSFCVRQGQQRYFLKLFDGSTALKLDRKTLFKQQQSLAECGLAAQPVYLSHNSDFQLDQWIDGATLQQSTLSRAEQCKLLALTLSNIHNVEMPLAKLDLAVDWQYYLALSPTALSALEQQQLDVMLQYWKQESAEGCVLCHNDLALSHITLAPNTVVFDWEYSALSNPFFDIASAITINELNTAEQELLLLHYATYKQLDVSNVKHKVTSMLPLVIKTNELWTMAFVR